jgi:hypothetical protein
MASSGMLHRVAFVRNDVSKEHVSVFLRSIRRLPVAANVVPSSPILVILRMEVLSSSQTSVLTRATWCNITEDAIFYISFLNNACQILQQLKERLF